MNFQTFIEILGTMAFAFSGAFAAMQKRLDIFGVLVLTFVTAIGGGTVRDLLMGSLPVAWLNDLLLVYTLLGSYILALLFSKKLIKLKHTGVSPKIINTGISLVENLVVV